MPKAGSTPKIALKAGLSHTVRTVVDDSTTAATMGSGDLDVFATPAMIALMERAAVGAVAHALPEGSTTVGTMVDIVHSRATSIGNEVSATAVLQAVEGRRLIFRVTAGDSKGIIGEGTHERVVVDRERFMSKIGDSH
jgi:predicted thioesterase